MASEAKKNPLDALSLLVDAANAQQSASQKKGDSEAVAEAPKSAPASNGGTKTSASNAAAVAAAQQRSAEMEFREALHRQAMEREALESEAMLQQRAALMSAGLAGLGGLNFQEAEYMQQLRLEALVQQRRQETLAQLALAQEYNPEAQAYIVAQLRQAAMLREQEILMAAGGMGAHMDSMAAALRQREGARNENALLRLFEERDRQHKLASLGAATPAPVSSMDTSMHSHAPAPAAVTAVPTPVRAPAKAAVAAAAAVAAKEDTALALAGSKVTVLPCRARGMPMDHNAKTAYFVVPEDVKHGAELVCSYDHCRNAGIKFRYCVFCSLPVAKRNFFKKHKHEGKIPPERLAVGIPKDEEMGLDLSMSSKVEEAPPGGKPVTRKWNTMELLAKALSSTSGLGKPSDLRNKAAQMAFTSGGEMAQHIEQRKRKWEKLLDTRPLSQSETELVLWIRKVLDVSDMAGVSVPTQALEPPAKKPKASDPPKSIIKEPMADAIKEAIKETVPVPKEPVKEELKEPFKEAIKEPEKEEAPVKPASPPPAPKEEKEEEKKEKKEPEKKEAEKKEEKKEEEEKADSSDGEEEEDNSAKDDEEDDDMDEDEKDGNESDGSASSSGSSVDLRAHKRPKKE